MLVRILAKMILISVISILLPCMAVFASEDWKLKTTNVDELYARLNDVSERFQATNFFNPNLKDQIQSSHDASDIASRELAEEIQLNFYRGQIATMVNSMERTIRHGLNTATYYREYVSNVTNEYSSRTSANIDMELAKAMERLEEEKVLITGIAAVTAIKYTPCIAKVLKFLAGKKTDAIFQIGSIISPVKDVLAVTVENIYCQLTDAIQTLEYILSTLESCNKLYGKGKISECLKDVLEASDGIVKYLLGKILSLVMNGGTFIKEILGGLGAGLEPVLKDFIDSFDQMAYIFKKCVSNIQHGWYNSLE